MIFKQIKPYLAAGILVVFFIYALSILFSVLFWGSILGIALFIIACLKQVFFPNKTNKPQTIEHDQIV